MAMHAMPTCLPQAQMGTFRPFSMSLHRCGLSKPSFAHIGRSSIRCSAADSPNSRGRTKSGRQQRHDAADTAKRGVDDAADSLKSGIRSAEGAVDDVAESAKDAVEDARTAPQTNTYDAMSSTRSAAADAGASAKGAVSDAADAAGPQRRSVAGAASGARSGIDSVTGAVDDASRAAERYAADPEAAVDDAVDAVTKGIGSAAENVKEGTDQAKEYVEDPKLAVSDAAGAAEEGVDSLAENVKAGVRAVRQGVADGADATEEAAEEAGTQSQPRIGARPVTVSYTSGAGTTETDTSTSSGPGPAPPAAAEGTADTARQVGAQVDDVADELERNIDAAAEQVEGAIEAAGERLEGAIDDAPRQTAAVLQQVVDSTADSIKSARSTAENVREDFEELQAPGPAAPFAATPLTSLPSVAADNNDVSYQKKRLLFSVAGLDRGFAANASAELAVETAIYSLVGAAGGSPPLTWTSKDGGNGGGMGSSTLGMLSGTWRLVYSSGFASGSLGGQRPGPPAALVPVTIGQVYQVISTATATLDNVVEFYVRYQLPSLPGLPDTEPIVATLRLRHSLEILPASNVQITFEDTQLSVTGGLGGVLGKLPELTVPQLPEPLKPSRQMRSSTFEVLFLDDDLRVTRGDRGELRVFVRT